MAATANAFPQFEDGDVTIVVSTSKIYRLHSSTLRRTSEYFRNIFDTSVSPKLTAAARREGFTPYRFVLFKDPNLTTEYGTFIPVRVSDSGRFDNPVTPRAPNVDIGGEDRDKCWDNLFGSFYGIQPIFDLSTFQSTVEGCFMLLDAAEGIEATKHVEEVVDLALMRQDKVLWESIASKPQVWAELGRRVRSPTIFKEAICHLVGQWTLLEDEVKENIPSEIAKLCQRKWDDLELAKRAIEIRIARHYPPFLCRNHASKPHRTAYATDIYMWMCLCFFRQYLSQSGTDRKNRLADDGGYEWYKQIQDGGSAYLDHDAMRTFHQFFPMSSKACGVVEAHMNVLKDEVKTFVKDLMIVRTHLDPSTIEGIDKPWLTCTLVEDDDLPWQVPATTDQPMLDPDLEQSNDEDDEDAMADVDDTDED